MKLALLDRLLAVGKLGTPAAIATDLATGAQLLVDAAGTDGDLSLAPEDLALVRQALADDRSRTIDTAAGQLFVEVWNPPLRLVVVGGVHTAQSLVPPGAARRI